MNRSDTRLSAHFWLDFLSADETILRPRTEQTRNYGS
jgi:hypothetical protein